MNDTIYPPQAYDELRVALRNGVERLISERQRRRRKSRMLALAVAVLLCLSGLALAATTFVSSPAPESVQTDIAAVDAGMPDWLRLNPDIHNAHSVASSGASTLWLAELADGGQLPGADDDLLSGTCALPAAPRAARSTSRPSRRRFPTTAAPVPPRRS